MAVFCSPATRSKALICARPRPASDWEGESTLLSRPQLLGFGSVFGIPESEVEKVGVDWTQEHVDEHDVECALEVLQPSALSQIGQASLFQGLGLGRFSNYRSMQGIHVSATKFCSLL